MVRKFAQEKGTKMQELVIKMKLLKKCKKTNRYTQVLEGDETSMLGDIYVDHSFCKDNDVIEVVLRKEE